MAEAAPAAASYFRVTRDPGGIIQTVETALVSLAHPDPASKAPEVDLIGVFHIADRSYYAALSAEFERYEAVLYECVLTKRRQVPTREDKSAWGIMVRGIARRLELEYQFDGLDYARSNFVHADMVQSEFQRSIRRRKESFLGATAAQLGAPEMSREEMNRTLSDGMVEFCRQFLSEHSARELKRQFADALIGAVAGTIDAFFNTQGSTVGSERNRIALRTLRSQWKKGKRRLALLYGCAHMGDFEWQLGEEYGLKRCGERWLVAWDLREQDTAHSPESRA
jgi:hypothetical protein